MLYEQAVEIIDSEKKFWQHDAYGISYGTDEYYAALDRTKDLCQAQDNLKFSWVDVDKLASILVRYYDKPTEQLAHILCGIVSGWDYLSVSASYEARAKEAEQG